MIHIKGRILQHLANNPKLWDWELADLILKEYDLAGDYWRGTVRVSLADLFSCGLIESVEEAIDDGIRFGRDKVLFLYRLTDFGKARVRDTGILPG